MGSLVLAQGRARPQTLLTLGTAVWPLPSVHALVLGKQPLVGEALVTQSAEEQLLPHVQAQVVGEHEDVYKTFSPCAGCS